MYVLNELCVFLWFFSASYFELTFCFFTQDQFRTTTIGKIIFRTNLKEISQDSFLMSDAHCICYVYFYLTQFQGSVSRVREKKSSTSDKWSISGKTLHLKQTNTKPTKLKLQFNVSVVPFWFFPYRQFVLLTLAKV